MKRRERRKNHAEKFWGYLTKVMKKLGNMRKIDVVVMMWSSFDRMMKLRLYKGSA